MSSSEEEPAPKRRRGVVNKETYKHNVVRNARVKGEGYVSHFGKQVAEKAKPSLDSLACKCNAKCSKRINRQLKRKI